MINLTVSDCQSISDRYGLGITSFSTEMEKLCSLIAEFELLTSRMYSNSTEIKHEMNKFNEKMGLGKL